MALTPCFARHGAVSMAHSLIAILRRGAGFMPKRYKPCCSTVVALSASVETNAAHEARRPRTPGDPDDALRKVQGAPDCRSSGQLSQLVRPGRLPAGRHRPIAGADAGNRS